MQSALRLFYPSQCLLCDALVEQNHALCGECWRDTPFISGTACDACGTLLHGDSANEIVQCDDCLTIARPWNKGRAALIYKGNARKMVLALKHGDRLDLALPAARWLANKLDTLNDPETILVPIPAHWTRVLRRRYNQSVELTHALAKLRGLPLAPRALIRTRSTSIQDGMNRDQRFTNLQGAIAPHPRFGKALKNCRVTLIDDVMTSGATFAAATEACYLAGADQVSVIALARVAKDA